MRITGGTVQGHNITVPKVSDLRPSQDIVREAIFNILQGEFTNKLVLDIFAGTGILGIEALSRNARHCDFVDKNKEACRVIKQNLQSTGFTPKGEVICEEAESFVVGRHPQPYDIIFLDPPYSSHPRSVFRMIPKILSPQGLLIYLHGKNIALSEKDDREWLEKHMDVVDQRRYGATHVKITKLKPKAPDQSS